MRVAKHPSETAGHLLTRHGVLPGVFRGHRFLERAFRSRRTGDRRARPHGSAAGVGRHRVAGARAADRAAKAAPRVAVYTHRYPEPWAARLAAAKFHRADQLEVFVLDRAWLAHVISKLERRLQFSLRAPGRNVPDDRPRHLAHGAVALLIATPGRGGRPGPGQLSGSSRRRGTRKSRSRGDLTPTPLPVRRRPVPGADPGCCRRGHAAMHRARGRSGRCRRSVTSGPPCTPRRPRRGPQVGDLGLDVGHLKVGHGVASLDGTALEDRQLRAAAAAETHAERGLLDGGQVQDIDVERPRALENGHRDVGR